MEDLELAPVAKKSNKKNVQETQQVIEEDGNLNIGFDLDPEKTYIFELIKKSDIPRLENLGSRCKIYDPNLKRYRELRYISVAPTIFYEEQHESFDNYPDEPLMFNRNQIYVRGSNRKLMEYMLMHDLCEGSPFRLSNKPPMYKLMDKDAEEERKAKRHAKEREAMGAIDKMQIADLRPIARVVFGITETSETAIRNALYELVKKEPKGIEKTNAEKVLENVSNPQLQRKYYIQSAFDNGVIASNKDRMDVRFVDGNVFVCNLTVKTPEAITKEVTDWSLTPEGQKFYTLLRQKL